MGNIAISNRVRYDEIEDVPDELLEIKDAKELYKVFPNPTLMYLKGVKKEPLFVTVLLHGNEDTGLFAIQKILKKYHNKRLPRSLIVFFGNIEAAKYGMRHLDNQPDYNRVWEGGELSNTPEGVMMQEILHKVVSKKPFASVDIHNNTGKNPFYACINKLEKEFIYLASLFSKTIVFFESPKGVQSLAMAKYCPAVTIECGKPKQEASYQAAAEYIDTLLHLSAFPDTLRHIEYNIFHTVARVEIPKEFSFSYSNKDADIFLLEQLEEKNFTLLPKDTLCALIKPGSNARFYAFDDEHNDRFDEFFYTKENALYLKKELMPSMITLDEKVIEQDCLCYLMEELKVEV